MRRRWLRPAAGFALGGAIGFGTLLALGATQGPNRPFPKYSVAATGGSLLITDNDTNTLYVYRNVADAQGGIGHQLHHALDLSQAGQGDLKALGAGKK